MSYEIIYDKQFVKLPNNNYIPMIYAGSSNCYESSNRGNGCGRRERSWFPTTSILDGYAFGTPELMLANVAKLRKDYLERERSEPVSETEFDKNFGYYLGVYIRGSRCTTFGMYEGIYKTGIRKALTVEELVQHNAFLNIHSYAYDEEKMKAAGLEPFCIYPKTGEEFIRVYEEKKAEFSAKGYDVYVSMDLDERQMKQIRKTYNSANPTKRVKKEVVVNEEYVFRYPNHGYFVKGIRRGFKYSYYLSYQTLRVFNRAAAEKKLLKLNEKYGKGFELEVVPLTQSKTVLV